MRLSLLLGTLFLFACPPSTEEEPKPPPMVAIANDPDSDGDGLSDLLEAVYGTDAKDADSDDDGLPDGIEDADKDGHYDTGSETNARHKDTDQDGLSDGWLDLNKNGVWNLLEGEDRNNNGTVDPGETDPRKWSTDGAMTSDGAEEKMGTDPLDPKDDTCGLDHVLDPDSTPDLPRPEASLMDQGSKESPEASSGGCQAAPGPLPDAFIFHLLVCPLFWLTARQKGHSKG